MSIHNVGEKFDVNKLFEAQEFTKDIVHTVSKKVFEGMTEAQGIELLNLEFKKHGEIKFWHPHKFRIGKNTQCSFKEESDHSVVLKKNDFFFIDVGPILFSHEGDYGETFIFGEQNEALKIKNKCEELFNLGLKHFKENKISGVDLYKYLENKAIELDVKLNMNTLGHRIGDFPHHLYYRGKMAHVEEELLPNLWVLEVQITNREGTIGAFFEDIISV